MQTHKLAQEREKGCVSSCTSIHSKIPILPCNLVFEDVDLVYEDGDEGVRMERRNEEDKRTKGGAGREYGGAGRSTWSRKYD